MNVLIVKPSSLGDVIHALPFLNAVKERYPDCRVDWVISKKLRGIVEEHPLIDRLIAIDKDSWKSILKLHRTVEDIMKARHELQSRTYDIVADLQGLLRSGIITFVTRSPLKVGFLNAREGSRYFYDKRVRTNGCKHAVDRNMLVARAIGAPSDRVEFPLPLSKTAVEKVKGLVGQAGEYVVLVPSARWPSKRWPPEHFASLLKKLKVPSVITGSAEDRPAAMKIIEGSQGNTLNLCGSTDLKELTALIAGAKVVVSNDSGPMHIAAALGIPTIALFGPTDPERTGPYGWKEKENISVITAPVPCGPCFRKRCRDPFCMKDITVETVLRELERHL